MKKIVPFGLGISIAGLGAAGMWIWFHYKVDEREHCVEIEIPNTILGYVIGRAGSTLRNIQTTSKARIKLVPELTSNFTKCAIKGDFNGVRSAATIIESIIKNVQENGITRSEHDSDGFEIQAPDDCTLVNIVSDVMEEVFGYHLNHSGSDDVFEFSEMQPESSSDFIRRHTQKLYFPENGLIPVYVSAVTDPELFYIQLIETREYYHLDRLTTLMRDFYEDDCDPNFSAPPLFSDIISGYICVVLWETDNQYYRAVVSTTKEKEENILDTRVNLHLLDTGDDICEKISNLRPIASTFLSLNFQAIKCGLAYTKPTNDGWIAKAIKCFEDQVRPGQRYTLMARIDFYEEGYSPYLTLFDNNGEESVNIAKELVSRSLAMVLG